MCSSVISECAECGGAVYASAAECFGGLCCECFCREHMFNVNDDVVYDFLREYFMEFVEYTETAYCG